MTNRYENCEWYSRKDIDWVYVRVKRAGSTWMTKYLLANGFERSFRESTLTRHHKLVVFREPLERFMSGVGLNNDLYQKLLKSPKKALDEYNHDAHIHPQVDSLKNIDLNNCTFIKYSTNWTKNFHKFLEQRGTILTESPPNEWYNKLTPFDKVLPNKNTLLSPDSNITDRFYLKKHFDENPSFNKVIMDYLEEDYKFYNKVEWYGTD